MDPPYWIRYNFRSYYSVFQFYHQQTSQSRVVKARLKVPVRLEIDPRGHFTRLRCAAIICIDRLAALWRRAGTVCRDGVVTHYVGPVAKQLINLCEFLANYP